MGEAPTFGRWLARQRERQPASHAPWTAWEEAKLRVEVAEGVEWEDIAARHGRSVAAVRRRARRLGADG